MALRKTRQKRQKQKQKQTRKIGGRAVTLRNNTPRINDPNVKHAPLCQCRDTSTDQACVQNASTNSLYCKEHAHCPGAPLNGYEPPYEPQKWNGDPAVTKSHNCYSYFADRIDPKMVENCDSNNGKNCRQFFPQPGALKGDRNALNASDRRTCSNVDKLIMADIPGLLRSSYHEKCPVGTSKGAMVVDEGNDYHFFRQDSDGMWSHKDGSNKVKRYDALKRRIFDPELASRDYTWQGSNLNYEDFCAFYCVPRDHEIPLGQGGSLVRKGGQYDKEHKERKEQVKPLGASWRDHRSHATRRRSRK